MRHQQDREAKLLSCRSIRVGTLTCGRDLWAVTVKKRLQNASGRNEFLPPGGWGHPQEAASAGFRGMSA